jgi:hypothetical protein
MNAMSLIPPKEFLRLPSPSIVPFRLGIKSDQTLRANLIPDPKQLRNVHIERAIRFRAGKQLMYRGHGSRYCVCRRPRALQEVEADLARFEVDVRVADGRYEADGGRREGICIGNVDVEKPAAACGGIRQGLTAMRLCDSARVKRISVYLRMPFRLRPS